MIPHEDVYLIAEMTDPEKYAEIRQAIAESVLDLPERHFLDFHFANDTRFARHITEFLCHLEGLSEGAGKAFIKRIGGLRGRESGTYEQIVQALCELVIAKKFVECYPPQNGYQFKWEPQDSARTNPEFMISCKEWRLLVEVKSPSLIEYNAKNRSAPSQLPARLPGAREAMMAMSGQAPALPLDNRIKDFLISAEKKFSSFVEIEIPTYGLLVICWGQRMFEAVTPLSSEACGLLQEGSFYEIKGEKVRFPHVSGVVVTQHQFFIQEGLAQRYSFVESLDYGEYWTSGSPPNPVFAPNAYAKWKLPEQFKEVLQTVDAGESLDPIAKSVDMVFWLPRDYSSVQQPTPSKVGRNEPCPCGSGSKYKKCCG